MLSLERQTGVLFINFCYLFDYNSKFRHRVGRQYGTHAGNFILTIVTPLLGYGTFIPPPPKARESE